jgi:predicted translin family RNA/ssDNA-binding protein
MQQLTIDGCVEYREEKPVRVINRRKSVQDEKDRLRQELRIASVKVPKDLGSASVEETRRWVESQKRAVKLLSKERASVPELRTALDELVNYIVFKFGGNK